MIIRNSGICPYCKDEIESKHRHDFVWCSCEKTFVDGGKDYLRRSIHLIETSITNDNDDKENK